jgi:hypothetical protein
MEEKEEEIQNVDPTSEELVGNQHPSEPKEIDERNKNLTEQSEVLEVGEPDVTPCLQAQESDISFYGYVLAAVFACFIAFCWGINIGWLLHIKHENVVFSYDRYYKTLGLTPNATLKDAKIAYHKLVRLCHPDKNSNADRAKLERIQFSWNILKNKLQKQYHREETVENHRPNRGSPYLERDLTSPIANLEAKEHMENYNQIHSRIEWLTPQGIERKAHNEHLEQAVIFDENVPERDTVISVVRSEALVFFFRMREKVNFLIDRIYHLLFG